MRLLVELDSKNYLSVENSIGHMIQGFIYDNLKNSFFLPERVYGYLSIFSCLNSSNSVEYDLSSIFMLTNIIIPS